MNLVLRSLDRIADGMAQLQQRRAGRTPAGPGRVDLTDTEWVMYQTVADYNADDFANADKILNYLQARLGYHRLQPGKRVTVNFRPHGSDVLLRPFDGRYASVLSVDQRGRAWLQFAEADWTRAVQLGHAHSSATNGSSPYEASVYEHVDPKKRALRVDPLDTKEYRTQLAKLGFQLPATQKLAADETSVPVTPPNCPQCAQPMIYKRGGYICAVHGAASESAGTDAAKTADPVPYFDDSAASSSEDDGADDESDGYFYDPLVRDLPDASREQYLYVVKNLNEFSMPGPGGDWSPQEEHVLQARLGGVMGTTLYEIDQLLRVAAKTADKPSPHMQRKIKAEGPSDERGPKHLTKHGAKLWDEMFQIPHVKEYVQGATNPGHAWARAFASFMAHSQHHHEGKGAKFKPVLEGWDEAKHKGWAAEGGAMRAHKHGKRLAKIKEHFKALAGGKPGKLPTEVSKPGKPAKGLPTQVQPGESKWVRMIRKRDGKLVQVRRGKHLNKDKYKPIKTTKKAADVRTVSWAW